MDDDDGKDECTVFNGVKIIPGKLVLRNAYEGKSFTKRIMFQNIAIRPVEVSVVIPKSYYYKFDKTIRREKISCGWSVSLWVKHTYTYVAPAEFHIQVYVNEKKFDYLIEVETSKGEIYCEPRHVQFGIINLGHAVHVRRLLLCNKGYTQSKFQFDIPPNNLGLSVFPRRGFLLGRCNLEVDIDLIGFEEGEYNKEMWIKCEPPVRFNIVVTVIKPKIQIYAPSLHTEFFLPLSFSPCYGGSSVKMNFVVFNYNVLETTYIIVPEHQRKIMTLQKAKKLDSDYKCFNFNPIIGTMKPYEKKTIEVIFEPSKHATVDCSHFVWFRVIRLECEHVDKVTEENSRLSQSISRPPKRRKDFISVPSVASFLDTSSESKTYLSEVKIVNRSFNDYLRICLYGVSKLVNVVAEPVQFMMNEMVINTEKETSLILKNDSKSLPIYFEYEKVIFINVTPSKGYLNILDSVQLKVVFSPKTTEPFEKRIKINLFYPSQRFDTDKYFLSHVGSVEIPVFIPILILTTSPEPKFNMGITPLITNEVGFMTDDIRFNTNVKKPKMTMQLLYQTNPEKKFDESLIAFPNDRPACLQPWRNNDIKCLTIFAKIPRVIAPKDEYMLTDDELMKKLLNHEKYKNYIVTMRESRIKPIPVWEDYSTTESKLLCTLKPIICPPDLTHKMDSETSFRQLKPIEIYFVHVNPEKIVLGSVLINSVTPYKIEICNENAVPVHILITSFHRHNEMFSDLPDEFIVQPNEKVIVTKNILVLYKGSFNTVLNVYLNRCHLIPVVLQAEVIGPIVTLASNEFIFDDTRPDHIKIISLKNTLNDIISYSWKIPENSCYSICPEEGTIPPGRHLYTEITYVPDDNKRNCVQTSLISENGTSQIVLINACYTSCYVDVLESSIHMPNVPINILVERTNVLRNQSNEMVLFKVKNPNPCRGITIEPESGKVYGKSDTVLTIKILFEMFVKFDCTVIIEFEYGLKTHFGLSGDVSIPNIVFSPKKIQFKRVPAGSYEIMPFQIFNKGLSTVHLNFPKNIYPELSVLGRNKIDENIGNNIEITLDENESVRLYINFTPFELLMDTVYLPVVINNMIGPTTKLEESSIFLQSYLRNLSFCSTEETNVEPMHIKKKIKLPILELSLLSCKQILRFSKTVLYFKYYQTVPSRSLTEQEIKISSHANDPVEFLIDISRMSPYFEVECQSSNNCVPCEDDSVKIFLIQPAEELVLTIKFIPLDPGDHGCRVPIYIKNVKDGNPFNYLLLRSHYPPPSFQASKFIFMESIPLNYMITKEIPITLHSHFMDCEVTALCDYENLRFEFVVPSPTKSICGLELTKEVILKVYFSCNTCIWSYKPVKIFCTCGADITIIVTIAAADDILTTYTFRVPSVSNDAATSNSRGFPLFPANSDTSEFAQYMRRCAKVVECWLYDQVLQSTYYYYIPEDMPGFFRTKKKDSKILLISYILQNLCGVTNDLIPYQELSLDEVQRVNQMHCNFKVILIYLRNRGLFIPHCRTRYLLRYKDYVIYMNKVRKHLGKVNEEVKTEEYFYRRSKQCWLDILLDIYKMTVISRINLRKRISRHSSINNLHSTPLYSPEQSLLLWLDKIYEEERLNLLQLDDTIPETFELPMKTISNFTLDFSNSLVMIAVTIHYCPYLKPYLKDIFVRTNGYPERSFHNAVTLLEVWKLLNCSFKIKPCDITNPIPLQMVFLAMFMYDFFPNLSPKEEVCFSTGLSFKETKEIFLKNPNSIDAHYEIKFLNNDLGCFRAHTSSNIIKISANKIMKLKIEFWAKSMKLQSCTLLLCGDIPGYIYSKSIAYTLNGYSHFHDEYIVVTFEVDLYKSIDVHHTIQTPYKEEAIYDCICGKGSPEELIIENLTPVSEYLKNIEPRTLYSQQHKLKTNYKGEGEIIMTICCLSTSVFKATIVFMNPNIGDFLFSVNVIPVNFNRIEKYLIKVNLPDDWDERQCNCCERNRLTNPKRCPKRVVLEIPSKNDQFWYIIMKAVMQCVPEDGKDVWEQVLETEMGALLLRWMMTGRQEQKTIDHLFAENLIYKVNNPNSCIVLPESVLIPNIRKDEMVEVAMHISGDINKAKGLEFSLESQDGTEFRWYMIEFEKKRTSRKSSQIGRTKKNSVTTMKSCQTIQSN